MANGFASRLNHFLVDRFPWNQWIGTLLGRKLVVALLIVCALIMPPAVSGTGLAFLVRIAGVMGLYMLLALGLNFVIGYVGLLDLGFMAFYAIGAYTSALLSMRGWGFWSATLAAVAVTVLFRLCLGAPVLRLRGDYLAIVTLGFGEIVRIVLNNWDSLTNGPQGLSLISAPDLKPVSIAGISLSTNADFYYLIFAFVLLAVALSLRLQHTRVGRAWIAIREDEVAAEHMGISVTRFKLLAFALSAVFAGIAGSIFARWENFISPESFTFWESAFLVSMVVLGGMGSVPGVLIGVVIVLGIPELLRSLLQNSYFVSTRYFIFGIALVIVAIFRPQGIFPSRRRQLELRETMRGEA
jgi:branched-chain amino acid transport system permease protein